MKTKDIKSIRTGIFLLNEEMLKLRYGMIQKGIINDITSEQLEIIQDSINDENNDSGGEFEDTVEGLLKYSLGKLMRLKMIQIKLIEDCGKNAFHTLTDIHERDIGLSIEDKDNLDKLYV